MYGEFLVVKFQFNYASSLQQQNFTLAFNVAEEAGIPSLLVSKTVS